MTSPLLESYEARHAEGALRADPGQRAVAERLDLLCRHLAGQRRQRPSLLARLRRGRAIPESAGARGLYIFGPPGRGKSMLMDLFFAAAPIAAKRRVHVHAFMQGVHQQLHRWRSEESGRPAQGDPLRRLAETIAEDTRLLCFDEFQVEAIADAMIVQRLFEALFDCGVTVVATSNTAPADLYRDGLQRERFLPFIALLQERLDVVPLDGGTDYRRDRLKAVGVFHSPLDTAAEAALEEVFAALTGGAPGTPDAVTVYGRTIEIPRQAHGVAWFSFGELCEQPLGAADFLQLACRFQTVILSGIPRLSAADRNAAKRFATLVESLYEQRVKLVCSAAVPPDQIYTEGDGAEIFGRVVSRLEEMQSEDYIAAAHRPANALAA